MGCVLELVSSQVLSSTHDQTGGIWEVNGCFPWLCSTWCVREQALDTHMGTDGSLLSPALAPNRHMKIDSDLLIMHSQLTYSFSC